MHDKHIPGQLVDDHRILDLLPALQILARQTCRTIYRKLTCPPVTLSYKVAAAPFPSCSGWAGSYHLTKWVITHLLLLNFTLDGGDLHLHLLDLMLR